MSTSPTQSGGTADAKRAVSSGLSVADFAACLSMGLEPVGLVQGFCAMQFSSYAMNSALQRGITGLDASAYLENYQCPHGMVSAEHRAWGQNYQQSWVESSWRTGFDAATARMLEEAKSLGAIGVVGVVDSESMLGEGSILEFHLRGTAVKLDDETVNVATPWTTYLAGQRLAKVYEAGFAPVSIQVSISSVRVWSYCVTEYLMGGAASILTGNNEPMEIEQLVRAKSRAREIVRRDAQRQLGGDALHGATLQQTEREHERGDLEIQSVLRGNRIRRFDGFQPRELPRPMVRLS